MNLESRHKREPLNENYVCPQIYWDLNWLNQWDHRLIKFIKENLLIPPPTYSEKGVNLQNQFDPAHAWKFQGQHGEALAVEYLYGLKSIGKNTSDKGLSFSL